MKELLKKAGLTQQELADLIGKSQRLVSAWCNGQCQPQVELLPDLSKILKVSIEELIFCIRNSKLKNSPEGE